MPGRSAARILGGLVMILGATLGGCVQKVRPVSTATVTLEAPTIDPATWSAIIKPVDATKIKGIDIAWMSALNEARPRNAQAIEKEGPLLDPAGALARPTPPPGTYRCRVVSLGSGATHRQKPFAQFKPFTCFVVVEDKLLVFMKATGTQLPGGRLWDDGDKRLVFLGAMAPRPGAAAPGYGSDHRQDRVAVVERVADFRWRMVTPWVTNGPTLEVMELVPDTPPAPLPLAVSTP